MLQSVTVLSGRPLAITLGGDLQFLNNSMNPNALGGINQRSSIMFGKSASLIGVLMSEFNPDSIAIVFCLVGHSFL